MLTRRRAVVAVVVVIGVAVGAITWLSFTTADRGALEQEERSMIDASLHGIDVDPSAAKVSTQLVPCDPPMFGRTKYRVQVTSQPNIPADAARPALDRLAAFWGGEMTGVLAGVHVVDVGMPRGDLSVFARSSSITLNAFDHATDGLVLTGQSDCVAL